MIYYGMFQFREVLCLIILNFLFITGPVKRRPSAPIQGNYLRPKIHVSISATTTHEWISVVPILLLPGCRPNKKAFPTTPETGQKITLTFSITVRLRFMNMNGSSVSFIGCLKRPDSSSIPKARENWADSPEILGPEESALLTPARI